MLPVALEPLYAADRTGAVETLHALALVRLAFREDLVAFGARVGLDPKLLEVWLAVGLVFCGTAIIEATRGEMADVLALTPKGARELARATGRVVKGMSTSRLKRSGAKLAHDATVGGAALAIIAAAREENLDLQGIETDDKVLGTSAGLETEHGPKRVPFQADGYALTHDGVAHRGLLLEIDRGTTAAAKLGEKFAAYAAWARAGGPERTFAVKSMRVLTLVPDERRLERLREVALEAVGRPSAMFLFALTSNVTAREPSKLLEPIAKTLSNTLEPLFQKVPVA